MICKDMSPEQWTELRETVKTAFKRIAKGISFHLTSINDILSACINPIEVLVGPKKISGKAIDIPFTNYLSWVNWSRLHQTIIHQIVWR
ncbi:hypothetical protein SD10_08485 [Spirosoma radiotolerans]|uniref:Uncharacterized protein n=1 Tax=Spirosoma radiotolerans TaxID=1379870 RepID=A0A0E3ZVA6_9BACT|nr:hypothetical protein SD10_08485 [Spirosoma radiotolerans]